MNKIKKSFPAALILLFFMYLFFSCTERINIDTDNAPERLVIYGVLTTDPGRHAIKITRSTGYFATSKPPGISHARVTISSSTETFILTENASEPGLYQTQPGTFGVEGETYTLHVALDFDRDGEEEEYTASTYLPYAARVDAIALRPSDAINDHIEVLLTGRIPENQANYMSFHVFRNDVIVNDSLVGFSIIDDEHIQKKEVENVACYFLDQDDERSVLSPGDIVTLRLDILTKEYAEFIENAQAELQGQNPIFGGPPANVQTNIRCVTPHKAIPLAGFFSAYSGRQTSTVYQP